MLFFSTENSLERSSRVEMDMDQYLFDHCSPSQVQLACCLKRRFSKVLLYDNLVFTQIYNLLPVWEVEFHIY